MERTDSVLPLILANIPGLPCTTWANAICHGNAQFAHKVLFAGANGQAGNHALTFWLHPELVEKALDYFRTVQTRDQYKSVPAPG